MLLELWGMVCSKLGILAFFYIIVLVVVLLDLWSGIHKAKKRNEYTSSYGMRRTVDKLCKYYNAIIALTVTDLLQMGFLWYYNIENSASLPLIPFVTALGAAFVCFVEVKSICESADKKMKGQYQEAAKQLSEILKQKDKADILRVLFEQMGEKKEDDNG